MKNIAAKMIAIGGMLLTLTATARAQTPKEFWICNNPRTKNLGTSGNPYDGSTQAKFDAVMSNMPPDSTVHIRPGTYETWGSYNWAMQPGEKIIGSGMNNTILQFPPGTPEESGAGNTMIVTVSAVTNSEVYNLTCDCNWPGAPYTFNGVILNGTKNIVKNVRVIRAGHTVCTNCNSEAWGISLFNSSLPASTGNIIENCEVSEFMSSNGISAISLSGAGANHTSIAGIVRNNRVLLSPDPVGAEIAFNLSWAANSQFDGNYVDGADSGVASDTGTATNIFFARNTFKNVYQGFVFWSNPRTDLTFYYNKIFLAPSGSYFSTGFGFPDGTWYTNVTILGNRVEFNGTPTRRAYFLYVSNIVDLTVAGNVVDSRLTNYISTAVSNMYNNRDLSGKKLPSLNLPLAP